MLYENINEDSLKSRVAEDWFPQFDCTELDKNEIDFRVKLKHEANAFNFEEDNLLWAESKQHPTDIYKMLAQLLLTIRKNAYNEMPPKFIGCFDCKKIAFIEYHYVLPVFALNDFNWTQTPSLVDDKTVETVRNTIDANKIHTYIFEEHDRELRDFIKANFNLNSGICPHSTLIDKNNFIFVFQKWLKQVKPQININWEKWKEKYGIYDRDFFLAELNIDDNGTSEIIDDKIVNRNFYITFHSTDDEPYHLILKDVHEELAKYSFGFKSGGLQQYTDFWKRYKRPPQNEFWNYIVNRLDLLVPQDVRKRKGAYYTPLIWVDKSQQYIADVLGENWQEEYYVWDCCAGTGNMEVGLKESYNVWASTIDQQDVDVMRENIRKDTSKMIDNHVFQFDFLNDDFNSEKVPSDLKKVLADPEKRKKLVIYINPPYAEPSSYGDNSKPQVANSTKCFSRFQNNFGSEALQDLFAQFFARIYSDLPNSILATFSTPKFITSDKFKKFRAVFKSEFLKGFVCKANSFDNVKSNFPIGFYIISLNNRNVLNEVTLDVMDNDRKLSNSSVIGERTFSSVNYKSIREWRKLLYDNDNEAIGFMIIVGPSMQSNRNTFITSEPKDSYVEKSMVANITASNLVGFSTYLAIRQCVELNWINNKDNYLYPNEVWKNDLEFQTNCLIYTLFHGQNKISATQGTNHWIPFTEKEVNSKERFDSHFMSDFLAGKIKAKKPMDLFSDVAPADAAPSLQFSTESQAVMAAGLELWRYYHAQPDVNSNASFYDIKEYFQGRNSEGEMNPKSDDKQYTELLDNLKAAMQTLAAQIRPKVYEYGFLK